MNYLIIILIFGLYFLNRNNRVYKECMNISSQLKELIPVAESGVWNDLFNRFDKIDYFKVFWTFWKSPKSFFEEVQLDINLAAASWLRKEN